VLIVDDTPENLTLMNGLLKDIYKTKIANNGERALKIAAAQPQPDLILLDIMMPGIDGWETLTRLKRDPATAGIPVVIFTAREHSRGHQKSADMGAADYFRKPFEPDELIELVEKHVGQRA
jgi:putative two-component system response regulator